VKKKLSLAPALVAIVDAQLPGQQHTPERLLTHLFASYQVIIKGKDLFPTGCTEREKTDGRATLTPDGSHQPRSAASHRSLASLLCSLPRTHSPRDAPGGRRRRRRCRRGRSSPIFLSLAPPHLSPSLISDLSPLSSMAGSSHGGRWVVVETAVGVWVRGCWGWGFPGEVLRRRPPWTPARI
jgi:hypothetical protein